jgi:hypothetical protein
MKLLDKYIYMFTRNKVRKTCLQNHPSLILKLPPIQLHFCKNNPKFFCNYKKRTLFTWTLNFLKLHINTHKPYTNKHILHTNQYMSSLQVHELSHGLFIPSVAMWRRPCHINAKCEI